LVLGLGLGLGKKDVGILLFITPYCLQAMYWPNYPKDISNLRIRIHLILERSIRIDLVFF
jgi:hypothetical protein